MEERFSRGKEGQLWEQREQLQLTAALVIWVTKRPHRPVLLLGSEAEFGGESSSRVKVPRGFPCPDSEEETLHDGISRARSSSFPTLFAVAAMRV